MEAPDVYEWEKMLVFSGWCLVAAVIAYMAHGLSFGPFGVHPIPVDWRTVVDNLVKGMRVGLCGCKAFRNKKAKEPKTPTVVAAAAEDDDDNEVSYKYALEKAKRHKKKA